VSIRGRVQKLERLAERNAVVIRQPDGPPAKFSPSDLVTAFQVNIRRLKAATDGKPLPEQHPLNLAMDRSSDPSWDKSLFGTQTVRGSEVPGDLSE
jgi:hypothetical protein